MGRRKNREPYWQHNTCVGCGEPFALLADMGGLMLQFCHECLHDFGIESEADAERLIAMFGLNTEEKKDAVPAKPTVDPEAVAAGIRTQVDYRVVSDAPYTKPITYECAKNGLFEVRHSDLVTIITKPKDVLGLTRELKEGITLNLPKVPFLFLQQTISFFRGVEGKRGGSSEALVQVWWDRQETQHILHVPEQQVSGGGVRHQSRFDHENDGRYLHVADIHSHGTNMSAFWSGTDNADEKNVTTERLFGVIGKVTRPIPDWKWRMRTRDGFIDLTVADMFAMPQESYTFTVKSEDLFRTINNDATFKEGRAQLWCPVDPFGDVPIPDEWYAQVKGYTHTPSTPHNMMSAVRSGTIKGFIYVNGIEYECDGSVLKPTGHKLLPKPV